MTAINEATAKIVHVLFTCNFSGCERGVTRACSSRKAVSKILANFGNFDGGYFQKRIISTTSECALKKNSPVIVFLYCDINRFKQGTLLIKLRWFKTLKIFSPWKQLFIHGSGEIFTLINDLMILQMYKRQMCKEGCSCAA